MAHPPPDPIVHVAPSIRDDSLALVVLDATHPDARGGSLRCSEATLRALPALIAAAIERFDAQRGRAT